MFNWQGIIVAFIFLLAGIYLGRRGWLRTRSLMRANRTDAPSCAESCRGCGPPTDIDIKASTQTHLAISSVLTAGRFYGNLVRRGSAAGFNLARPQRPSAADVHK